MTTLLVVLSVVAIVALIAVLALYLYWVGNLLSRVADNLKTADQSVSKIAGDGALIVPGVERINRTAGSVAGALPLLYGFAEQIIEKVSANPQRPSVAAPASGTRRSRLLDGIGFNTGKQ